MKSEPVFIESSGFQIFRTVSDIKYPMPIQVSNIHKMQLSCIMLEDVLNYDRDAERLCKFGIKSKFNP
jgi:hypothetical protein